MYRIEFEPAAFRIFKKLPREIKEVMATKAQVLKQTPFMGEPLKGKHRLLRSLHFGYKGTAYRIIYQVFSETHMIIIRLADKRENIYRRLEEMGI